MKRETHIMTQDTTSANTNGNFPAYPVSLGNPAHGHQDGPHTWQFPGLSIRDYFAAKAMQGAFDCPIPATQDEKDYIATHAYRMADAMLKARAEGGAA
jgi:hypothetical protein